MKEIPAAYKIARAGCPVDWSAVPVLPIARALWTENAGVRAEGRLCFDAENLYVRLNAAEKEIRAEHTRPLSPVHEDSCLEFFFMPDKETRYLNFEANPNGLLRVQFGTDRANRFDLVKADAAAYFDIKTSRSDGGWTVSYRIPLGFLRLVYPGFRFSGDLLANFYKCGDKTARPHYLSWTPIGTETPDFHRPEFFARLRFGE